MENIIYVKAVTQDKSRQQFVVLPNFVEVELNLGSGNDQEGNSHLCLYINLIADGNILCQSRIFIGDHIKEWFENNSEDIMKESRNCLNILMARTMADKRIICNDGTVIVLEDADFESIRLDLLCHVRGFVDGKLKESTSESGSTTAPSDKSSSTQKKKEISSSAERNETDNLPF